MGDASIFINVVPDVPRAVIFYGSILISAIICIYIAITFCRSKQGKEWFLEDKMFMGICILTFCIGIFPGFALLFLGATIGSLEILATLLYVPDILNLVFALSWLLFFDYIVNKNIRRLQRHIRLAALPFGLLLVMEAFMIKTAREAHYGRIALTVRGRYYATWISVPYTFLELLLIVVFMYGGFKLMRDYHEKRLEPMFFRFDYFIIPWIIGTVLQFAFLISVSGVFDAIALFIASKAFMEREKYLDRDTGAYNEQFLTLYDDFMEKEEFSGITAFVVRVASQKEALLDVIKDSMPDKAVVVRLDNGAFLIFAEVLSKMPIEMFERSMQDSGFNHDPPVSVYVRHYTRLAQESASEFTKRVLEKAKK